MKSLPLIRARYATYFMEALDRHSAPIEKYLDQSNLPIELLEHEDGLISSYSLLKFSEIAAIDTGILDLGFWAACAPIEEYGDFGSQITYSHSLQGAINAFCREARSEDAGVNVYMNYGPTTSWLKRINETGTPIQQQQFELYDLMMMVKTVQEFLGADWHPSSIRLMHTKEQDIANNDFFTKLNIEFNARTTGIAIPTVSLATQRPYRESNSSPPENLQNRICASEIQSAEPFLVLQELLKSSMPHIKHPSIKYTADLAGISTRSLQRFLLKMGTTHTKLIDNIRYDLAVPLLNDKAIKITEIANELGYADVAHFSRAFRRIAGMSPRTYRSNLKT